VTPEEVLQVFVDRKRAYQLAFNTPGGKVALDDLDFFCRARETCVVPGDRDLTHVLEGRREVSLRIHDYLERTPEELRDLYTRPAKGAISHDD
jgi:hypothetical protein